jgi:hypothetical protein
MCHIWLEDLFVQRGQAGLAEDNDINLFFFFFFEKAENPLGPLSILPIRLAPNVCPGPAVYAVRVYSRSPAMCDQ